MINKKKPSTLNKFLFFILLIDYRIHYTTSTGETYSRIINISELTSQIKETAEQLNTEYTNLILYGSDKTLPELAVTYARTLASRSITSKQAESKTNGKTSHST